MFALIIDFGLLILIWMTQLIVYPSFNYYSTENLLIWHKKYTLKITLIVLPLMALQVLFHGLSLLNNFSFWSVLISVLIAGAWYVTFFHAVPLHNKITNEAEIKLSVRKLVQVNWFRTLCWTLSFVLSFTQTYLLND